MEEGNNSSSKWVGRRHHPRMEEGQQVLRLREVGTRKRRAGREALKQSHSRQSTRLSPTAQRPGAHS